MAAMNSSVALLFLKYIKGIEGPLIHLFIVLIRYVHTCVCMNVEVRG